MKNSRPLCKPVANLRRFVIVSLLLLLLMPQAYAKSTAKGTILFFGDSLTAAYGIKPEQGWVAVATPELAREGFSVINASVSGETTAGGLARLPALLKKHRPVMLVLALGANDGLRGLDPTQMQRNLQAMVQAARLNQSKTLIIGMRLPPNYGPEYAQEFEATFKRVADLEKADWLAFLLEPIATDRNAFQADALHPTAAAQPKVWQYVRTALLPALKKLRATAPKGR